MRRNEKEQTSFIPISYMHSTIYILNTPPQLLQSLTMQEVQSYDYPLLLHQRVGDALVRDESQRLREYIGLLSFGWYVQQFDVAFLHVIADEMMFDIDMFRPIVMNVIVGHIDAWLVVAAYNCRCRLRETEFAE